MKKKLLFVIPIFPNSLEDDTIVPFIFQFCLYLNDNYNDLEIDIMTLRYPIKKDMYSLNSLNIYPVGGGFKNKWNSLRVIYKSVIKGISLFKQKRYDGVLSFWYYDTTIVGTILNRIFKIPHYTWMQGQDVKSDNKYLKFIKPQKNKLIVVGKNQNELLMQHQGYKAKIIANVAINPKNFPELNVEKRNIDIIGVGNLGALKNYSFFIEIIAELKKTFKNINAVICGDGEERDMLLNKIKTLGLTKNVKLLGYVSNKKTRELMNNSKILLHTSKFEGNSTVVQEALFSGCKVISTVPLQENVLNFFFEGKKDKIVQKLKLMINNEVMQTERVRHFKIEDTAHTIYSCFFNSKESKTV